MMKAPKSKVGGQGRVITKAEKDRIKAKEKADKAKEQLKLVD